MYKHILVPLDNSKTDLTILRHIRQLAKLANSKVTLVHVADGFVARHKEMLNLADSPEMQEDQVYLESCKSALMSSGLEIDVVLEAGEPAKQILKLAEEGGVDLIAMATHGHGVVGDFILGSVADAIRHKTNIPVLLIKAER